MLSLGVHKLPALLILAMLLASCRATLRPDFVKVVALLGKPLGIDAGNCKSPDKLKAAYDADLAKEGIALADSLLPFAQKAASICPESRPFLRTANDVELKTVAAMIGANGFAGDGRMQLEPWLWLRVSAGKVIGFELELDEF
jgi:hypothetical protein